MTHHRMTTGCPSARMAGRPLAPAGWRRARQTALAAAGRGKAQALAVIAALSLAVAGGLWPQHAMAQPAAAAAGAPTDTLRAAVLAPVQAAQKALAERRFQEALEQVRLAEAVADRTPYENFILDQLRGGAAAGLGDDRTALRSFGAAIDSGRMAPADAVRLMEGLVGTSFRIREYPETIRWAQRYLAEGGTNAAVRRVLANALALQGDRPAALRELQKLLADDEHANRRPPEDALRLTAQLQDQTGDAPGYLVTLERLLRHHPKPAYWRERIARLQQQGGFDEALLIDSYRLLQVAGGVTAADDDLALASLALKAGLPGEARRALEAGFAAGRLGSGAEAASHRSLRERAEREATADAAQLAQQPPDPRGSADAWAAHGVALATAGRVDDGVALLERTLARDGLSQAALVRVRLAWLHAGAGRIDKAQAVLQPLRSGTVAGPPGLEDLVRLWGLQLAGPAGAAGAGGSTPPSR